MPVRVGHRVIGEPEIFAVYRHSFRRESLRAGVRWIIECGSFFILFLYFFITCVFYFWLKYMHAARATGMAYKL